MLYGKAMSETNRSEKGTKHKLDLRGAIIPFTLLRVSQVFRTIRTGDVLEVFWSDPDTPTDLFKILPEATFELITMSVVEAEEPFYRVEILKKPAEPPAL